MGDHFIDFSKAPAGGDPNDPGRGKSTDNLLKQIGTKSPELRIEKPVGQRPHRTADGVLRADDGSVWNDWGMGYRFRTKRAVYIDPRDSRAWETDIRQEQAEAKMRESGADKQADQEARDAATSDYMQWEQTQMRKRTLQDALKARRERTAPGRLSAEAGDEDLLTQDDYDELFGAEESEEAEEPEESA